MRASRQAKLRPEAQARLSEDWKIRPTTLRCGRCEHTVTVATVHGCYLIVSEESSFSLAIPSASGATVRHHVADHFLQLWVTL